MTATVLPFVKVADLPVARPFPLAARIENTRAVLYFPTDAARIERAVALVTNDVRCVMLPKIIQS